MSPSNGPLAELARRLRATAEAHNHRQALVLAGSREWCFSTASVALQAAALQAPLWITDRKPDAGTALKPAQAGSVLGREFEALVYDAYAGFDPDAFGAVAGTIRGGGLLLLLTPPLQQWPSYPDPENARIAVANYPPEEVSGRFQERLAAIIRSSRDLTLVEQEGTVPKIAEPVARPPHEAMPHRYAECRRTPECRTSDQCEAVDAVIKVADGHRRRPLVLTSDRGRGKSTALGIAAARLLRERGRRIIVTGPRREAVVPVFEHARRLLPGAEQISGDLFFGAGSLHYAPPDALALTGEGSDLLLVDEAAAIPTPLLEKLLERHARIVFSTTIHGYEGTGRGFAVRFQDVLNRQAPGWRALALETPVRWAPDDPVERFTFRALLLDASTALDEAVTDAIPAACEIERVDRDRLIRDEAAFSELFGLLVTAHYRTRPGDLRNLLDGPNLCVYAVRYQGHVVATALVAREGGFDPDLSSAIYTGQRRPRGHLLAQTLAAHVGLEQAPELNCARIMRIAVHPAIQGRGIGTRLIEHIVDDARGEALDYVGSSFGATPELLRFWAQAGFSPVRLGMTRGHSSGAHSVVMVRPVSDAGACLCSEAHERFHRYLPHLLSEPLEDAEPAVAAFLLRSRRPIAPRLDRQDWRDICAFAFALRGYDVSSAPVWELVSAALADDRVTQLLDDSEQALLISKVLQRKSWAQVASALDYAGRNAATDALRKALRPLILEYSEEWVQEEAKRLLALGAG